MKKPTDYTDEQLLLYGILYLILGILLIILGLLVLDLFLLKIIFVIVGILFCYAAHSNKKIIEQRNEEKAAQEHAEKLNTENRIKNGEMNYNLFYELEEDNVLCYNYEENLCVTDIDLIVGNGGKNIDLIPEPENEYDDKTITAYLKGEKIGYIFKGTIRDMIHDWIKREWKFIAYINKFNQNDGKATYKIGFYKPLDIFESKTFSLVKITKKADEYSSSRYENLSYSEEGDELNIEDDTLIVMNSSNQEIGELPASSRVFLNKCQKNVSILTEIDEDDDKIHAKVTIYKIK